ncbi:hypothetical protein [Eel River basin pequenovirus]|nr:hypothetical protein [Eel River basin pequenovirus]
MRERRRHRIYPEKAQGAMLDATPIHVATKTKAKRGLRSQIQDAIANHELARLLAEERAYVETPQEADDFDVGDDNPSADHFDSDIDPPQEALDTHDELDSRLDSALRRVLTSIGVKVPESSSAPDDDGKGGEKLSLLPPLTKIVEINRGAGLAFPPGPA